MGAVGSGRAADPTIYDVAQLAGVSASAVSRALNKPGRLNLQTEQRIRDAADRLGYRGNPMARSLQTGRTGNIALIVSDLTNPVYFDLIRGAERATGQHGLTMVFADLQERAEQERDVAVRLGRIADGLILAGSRLSDQEVRDLADSRPVVTINRAVEGVPSAVADVRPGIEQALDNLFDAGHRRITYAAGPAASWMNARRREALQGGCARRGILLSEIPTETPTIQGGDAVLTAVLAHGASAVVTYNDLLAFGVLRSASARGVSIPAAFSVVGFDDIFGADLIAPPLSTIRSPVGELAEEAVRLLTERVAGEESGPGRSLETAFVGRATIGEARA